MQKLTSESTEGPNFGILSYPAAREVATLPIASATLPHEWGRLSRTQGLPPSGQS